MPWGVHHSRLWWSVLVGAVGLIGLVALATYQNRHALQGYLYCSRIKTARNASEASAYVRQLFHCEGRKDRLAVAVRQLGSGCGQLDYTILAYAGWPQHEPPHPVAHLTGLRLLEYANALEDYCSAVLQEINRRPALADLYIHRLRYSIYEVGLNSSDKLSHIDDFINPEVIKLEDVGPIIVDEESDTSRALALAVACRLTGRDEMIPHVRPNNAALLGRDWGNWFWGGQSQFMRFDPTAGRLVLDTESQRLGKPIEDEEAIWLTAVTTPVPGWSPPLGWGLVHVSWE